MHKSKNRFISFMLSCLTVFSLASPVMAENETIYPTFDESRTGSITLYKYVSNDGKTVLTDGTSFSKSEEDNFNQIQAATGSYQMLPEKGVEFAYLKVGDFEQVSTNYQTEWVVSNIHPYFLTTLENYGQSLTAIGSDYPVPQSLTETGGNPEPRSTGGNYKLTDVVTAMSNTCKNLGTTKAGETALRELVEDYGTAFEKATNIYGKTSTKNLPVGLYLIAEINWEHQSISKYDTYWQRLTDGTADGGDGSGHADIASPSSPFLVQLPITASNGTGWIYDITAYPKNGTVNIHKDIVCDDYATNDKYTKTDTTRNETLCDYMQINYTKDPGSNGYEEGIDDSTMMDSDITVGLTHQMDAKIGDTVTQVIAADVPALVEGKKNRVFKISDNLTKGLSFKNVVKVSLGTSYWNSTSNTVLTPNTDYTVSTTGGDTFTVELTANGLAKLDAITSASYVYVLYDSILCDQAEIGTNTYIYTTENNERIDATNQGTAKLTYATDRTEEHIYYSNTTRVYTYQAEITKTITGFTNEPRDYSKVKFKIDRLLENGTWDQLELIQTSDGTYYCATSANPTIADVSPSTADGKLTIIGLDSGNYRLTETATVPGQQVLAEPFYFEVVANMMVDENIRKFEDGSLEHVYLWSGEKPADLKNNDVANTTAGASLSKGIIRFQILNDERIAILATGGNGVAWAVGIGGMCFALALFLLCKDRKETNINE